MRLVIPALVCVLLLAATRPVAGSTVSAEATAIVYDGSFTVLDSDQATAAADTAGPVSATAGGAEASASVTNGVLHAYAESVNGLTALASTHLYDTLLLTSDTLLDGTPVGLLVMIDVSYSLTPTGLTPPCLSQDFSGVTFGVEDGAGQKAWHQQDFGCDEADLAGGWGVLFGVIGQELTVHAYLEAGADGLSIADASNSLRFFLTPNADFRFTAASGNTYSNAAPVPEPSTLLLFTAGAMCIGWRRRGRQA